MATYIVKMNDGSVYTVDGVASVARENDDMVLYSEKITPDNGEPEYAVPIAWFRNAIAAYPEPSEPPPEV